MIEIEKETESKHHSKKRARGGREPVCTLAAR